MLSREQAAEQLRSYAESEPRYPLGISLSGLGEEIRVLTRLMQQDTRVHAEALAARIDGMSDRRRTRLFAAFAPKIAAELNRLWVWAASTPYQTGWQRKPYRTDDPVVTLARRIDLLQQLLRLAMRYRQDVVWFARWAGHAAPYSTELGLLFASEISAGNTDVRDLLVDSALGRDEVGVMDQHVVVGLLAGSDPEGWACITDLLVKAQRQEGLRQSVLEAADFGHPDGFRSVLDVIVDHKLTRFAATVRAASVWFGEQLDARQDKRLLEHLRALGRMLDDPPTDAAVAGLTDPCETFLALWSLGFRDVPRAIALAGWLMHADSADIRMAAARFLVSTRHPGAHHALTPALSDDDPRVLAVAVNSYEMNDFGYVSADAPPLSETQIGLLLGSMERLGRAETQQVGLLGTAELKLGAGTVADRLIAFTPRELEPRIAPAFERASAGGRLLRVARLAEDPDANRAALLEHVGDTAQRPRAIATRVLLGHVTVITEQEAVYVESLLTRKASDLRRSCMELLQRQPPPGITASVERLRLGSASQVAAAAELSGSGAGVGPGEPDEPKRVRPADLVVDHAARTPATRPVAPPVPEQQHERCVRLLTSLVGWLDEHKDVEVRVGSEVQLLADLRWLPLQTADGELPLAEVIGPWWERTQPGLVDGGLECALVSRYGVCLIEDRYTNHPDWMRRAAAAVVGPLPTRQLEHPLARAVLNVLARRELRASWVDPLLDAHATMLAALPEKPFAPAAVRAGMAARQDDPRAMLPDAGLLPYLERGLLSPTQLERWWVLSRFLDEPAGRHVLGVDSMVPSPSRASMLGVPPEHPQAQLPLQVGRMPPEIRLSAAAFEAGLATEADLLDQLTMPSDSRWRYSGRQAVGLLTGRVPEAWVREATRTASLVERVTASALAFEVHRGEHDTYVSDFVAGVRTTYGIVTFVSYLAALGQGSLVRGYAWTRGRDSALCQVIRKTLPAPEDTSDAFAQAISDAGIPQKRLVEVGVYAPQWAAFVEQTLGWPGYEDAVWWLHAHTKGEDWTVDRELRAEWAAQASQRTPLDAEDLTRGAVDVQWFRDVLEVLGEERFETLLKAAKYASTSGGHKRAELFAKALRGQVSDDALRARIAERRHQDSVRALGLLPLGAGPDGVLLDRYELLRGFVASDRSSGSQRRASESTAVEVGLENLARTAGYRDPQRLVWAMEAHAVRDLADGPVTAIDGDLSVTLAIDGSGSPDVQVRRGEKPLAVIPKKSAQVPEIAELKARVTTLRKQAARMRRSLEQACVTGETFAPAELDELQAHPMIRPMLRDLVLVDDAMSVGFAGEHAGILLDELGQPVPSQGALRVAHPLDLLRSGRWPAFQHALFDARRRQPFRQVFRELYTVTDIERETAIGSRRYAGHQVQSRQAGALFGSRGWVADFEVGFGKTFHAEKLTAWCSVLDLFGTPGDVEDATIDVVTFHPARSWQPMSLDQVPPRIFSEVMRDLDLVVSVAHAGGVDPESSESSVEMRARLVEETCALLGLDNVETTGNHAMVKGTIATYSVNLGSGVVHRQPGGAVCIVPVSAQHRGRIFLPFVDDDPRTAEVLSKVVMLARDDKISDPTILAQLR